MSIAYSASDLYKRCKQKALESNLTEDDIPSFSWFQFQFWPNEVMTHTALRFHVKYMMQQQMVRKDHDDDHYAIAIFKYAENTLWSWEEAHS